MTSMCLMIDDDWMSSEDTTHTATRHGDKWEVSWLPGRRLTRDEAITAMTLAWQVTRDPAPHSARWPFIVAWAGELGLSGQEAVAMCSAREENQP